VGRGIARIPYIGYGKQDNVEQGAYMDVTEYVEPGMKKEITFRVGEEHSAVHVGSGALKVLATPIMIAYMERAGRDLLQEVLPQGYSSVGVTWMCAT
jgi:hypothetical protein